MSGIPAGAGQLLGKRLGKFEILALLALGGTAEIYLARIGGAAGFEKYVVVKCLHDHLADDAEFVKMFLDEARLAAHLDHSNIVQTMELGQHEGRYYMVMEFLAGLSLAMIVRRAAERLPNTRIPVPLVLNMLAQSCAGLHYAHEKAMNGKPLNIVHRDISPQNLVISFEGVVKVVDFGIAKAEMRETRTRSGTIKGKFAYMSPEQCVANNVDRRTDVFALGVIGHELLTGRRLFKRPSPYETYQAVIECEVKPPSTFDAAIDPAIDAVIMRAITKDKEVRYPTAEAFGDALLGYLHHRGIGSGPGDVSRFFDAYFGQELEEHSGRMRELISGRDISVDTGVSWGGDDADDDARPASAGSSGSLVRESGDIEELQRDSAGSLPTVLDGLGPGSRVEDDDEMPAERTRIEANPLERINELDRVVSSAPAPKASKSGRLPPSVPVPAPPPGGKPAEMPPSGRFPDLANLPTMIAAGDSVPAATEGFGNAPTTVAPTSVPPAVDAFGNAPTRLAPNVPPAAPGFANAPTYLAPVEPNAFANAPTHIAGPLVPMGGPPPHPDGYPVMNAQLSEQIATGATVFPSAPGGRGGDPGRNAPHAHAGPPNGLHGPSGPQGPMNGPMGGPMNGPMGGPMNGPMGGPHGPNGPQDGPPSANGPHDLHGAQGAGPYGPGPYDGQTHDPHAGYPRAHDPADPQRAAQLLSPVGDPYADQVNWAAAAATRARAVPPWLLGILFLGAIGIALALTVVIARIIR